MQLNIHLTKRARQILRTGFGYSVGNGITVALGWALVFLIVKLTLGPVASAAASVGALVAAIPDRCAPQRDKLSQMLPAPILSLPVFFAVQYLAAHRFWLLALIVVASFFSFLIMAWGKRGIPVAIAVELALIFSLATRPVDNFSQALLVTGYFGLGSFLYVIWAVLTNMVFNARFRVQYMADLLLSLAALLRAQAHLFNTAPVLDKREKPGGVELLRAQAALADQLQATRDIVLESPRTPLRQRLAAMLIIVLEMRDHILASELDLDALIATPTSAEILGELRDTLNEIADSIDALADSLLFMRRPTTAPDLRPRLAQLHLPQEELSTSQLGPSLAVLARGIANRMGHLNDEVQHLYAIATGEQEPDLSVVRVNWQMFVSPTHWSVKPLISLWRWEAPALRHAIRAALALGFGYIIASQIPWMSSHAYWVLLTITVVLRGSLSQTLERRNQRVAGTLAGCVIALALLSLHPPELMLVACMVLAQCISQAFAIRRYLFSAVAATVVGLVQAHMLAGGGDNAAFSLVERIVDTLLGTGIAWAFCFVLPSWERVLIPGLVNRILKAQAHHARLALGLGPLRSIETSPELEWRLARREAYDSLSALVQATGRALVEPKLVRPPIEQLEYLQAHCYQLLGQLSAVKTMLVMRHDRLDPKQIEEPLQRAAATLDIVLTSNQPNENDDLLGGTPIFVSGGPVSLPDPFSADIAPWLLRRLDISMRLATQLRVDANRVLSAIDILP
jgi:uncharacterized membrane protein YccC